MKEFVKNNPTLALGLGLPLLLVVVFTLAAGLPNLTAETPKYDVVFATNYYTSNEGVQISVSAGHARASYIGECSYCQLPELYRYNSASGTIKRINYDLPPGARKSPVVPHTETTNKIVTPLSIPELEKLTLNDANPAPDGYEFTYNDNYSSGGLLPELFFARSSYNNEPVLRKGMYRIRLPLARAYYNASNVRFLGWVEAE